MRECGRGGSGRATDDWLFPRLLLIPMSPGLGVVLASLALKAVRDRVLEVTEAGSVSAVVAPAVG